jgi:hypothetical protein
MMLVMRCVISAAVYQPTMWPLGEETSGTAAPPFRFANTLSIARYLKPRPPTLLLLLLLVVVVVVRMVVSVFLILVLLVLLRC